MAATPHPLSTQVERNWRKRQLLEAWIDTPPLQVIFDSVHPEVIVRRDKRDSYKMCLSLHSVTSVDEDGFTVSVCYEGEQVRDEARIPWSAIHALVNTQLFETHLWSQDLDLAEARYKLQHSQTRGYH